MPESFVKCQSQNPSFKTKAWNYNSQKKITDIDTIIVEFFKISSFRVIVNLIVSEEVQYYFIAVPVLKSLCISFVLLM